MSEKVITAYKAFDKNMKCRGFQYRIGKEYDIDGEIELCGQGFHACKSPCEIWEYYNMLCGAPRFAEVELSGKILEDNSSTKVCSSHIKIKKELSLTDIINLSTTYFKNTASISETKTDELKTFRLCDLNFNTELVKINSDENFITINADKVNTIISASGSHTTINSNAQFNQLCSTGSYAKISSTGSNNQIVSTGDFSSIISSGFETHIASTGSNAQIVSSDGLTEITSIGDDAHIITVGRDTFVNSNGNNAVIVCEGRGTKVKAKKGSLITLTEWWTPSPYREENVHNFIKRIKTEYVDGVNIKGDTWYEIRNGEFVETRPYTGH